MGSLAQLVCYWICHFCMSSTKVISDPHIIEMLVFAIILLPNAFPLVALLILMHALVISLLGIYVMNTS